MAGIEIVNTAPVKGGKVFPTLAKQLGNAMQAGGRILDAMVRGDKVRRPEAEQEACRAICESQTDGCYDAESKRCRRCGCTLGVPLVNKITWATESCPKGLWKKYELSLGTDGHGSD